MIVKRLIILIIGSVMLAGSAMAAQQPAPYPASFWINGTLAQNGAPGVKDYKVVFYNTSGTPSTHYAKCMSDASGKFHINVMDDLGLLPLAAKQYYIGVVQKDGFGVSESDNNLTLTVADLTNGYRNIDLTLIAGHGIPDPDDPGDNGLIRGTTIKREADDPGKGIILSWTYDPNLAVKKADIWRLAGAAKQFSETDTWVQVATALDGPSWTDNSAQTPAKVGDGSNAYYRIVPTGTVQANIFLPANNARTAGKIDVLIPGVPNGSQPPYKYSFVSHPFASADASSDSMFGKQLTMADSQATASEIWGWTGVAFGQQEFSSAAGWKIIGAYQPVRALNGECVVIKTKEGMPDHAISLVGIIMKGSFGPKKVGENLYTFMGDPYPFDVVLGTSNLTSAKGAYEGDDSGFADQLWGWTGVAFGDQVFLKKAASWQKLGFFNDITSFKLGKGYVYRRNPSAPANGFDWGFTP